MVPAAGLEPARPCGLGILRLARKKRASFRNPITIGVFNKIADKFKQPGFVAGAKRVSVRPRTSHIGEAGITIAAYQVSDLSTGSSNGGQLLVGQRVVIPHIFQKIRERGLLDPPFCRCWSLLKHAA